MKMGSKVSSCGICDNLFKCWHVLSQQNHRRNQYETGSLVEFENLIDEVEYRQPSSILTVNERNYLKSGRFDLLSKEQESKDSLLDAEYSRHEEELELEEEVAIESRREAARVAKMVQSPEIIDPAKLAFTTHPKAWGFTEVSLEEWNESNPSPVQTHSFRNKNGSSRIYYHHQNQIGSSLLRQQTNTTTNSTPPSSIDLEWENEEGLTPPANLASVGTTDEEDLTSMAVTSTPSDASHRSTPLSNGNELEWDFTSAHITELDAETEQLISEIERMTENALKQTDTNR